MKRWIWMAALAAALGTAGAAGASDTGYIYGRVVTDEGNTYEGQLRWGDEEAFWHDLFNATKSENEHIADVDDDVLRDLRRRDRDFWESLFANRDSDFEHLFVVRFGDLKRIEPRSRSRVDVEFRNGKTMELDGGSNDVGARITVVDPYTGTHRLRWERIKSIEFSAAPATIKDKLGDPLYGTVKTRRHEFTGHIQWDNDEALTIDELNGDTRDGDVDITFGDIAKIRKHRSGSMVKLKSGNEVYLTGSNDVNDENRGVVVKVPGIGTVMVGWDDFEEVTFKRAPDSGSSYADYGAGRKLNGVVETRSGPLRGDIVYDLDEAWDFELLHGDNGDTRYLIPFREIAQITPRGRYRAEVLLKSGLTIELEESQDVSRDNDGVLVYTGSRRPEYVEWRDVNMIRFAVK